MAKRPYLSDETQKVVSDQGKRCVACNEWTLEDTIQSPLHQGKWRISSVSHGLIWSTRGWQQPSASSSTMSSASHETAQLSGAVVFGPMARDRSSAGSHPRKSKSSSPPIWPERRHSPWPRKHFIHRTSVLGLLERHQVARRGRVLTPDHIERAVASYASGRSCASIANELHVNPETVRQALLKAGVAMRRPGSPRATQET